MTLSQVLPEAQHLVGAHKGGSSSDTGYPAAVPGGHPGITNSFPLERNEHETNRVLTAFRTPPHICWEPLLSGSETNCTSAFHPPTPEHSLAVLGGRAGTRGALRPRQASVMVGQAYTAEASPGLPHVTIRGLCKVELSLSLGLLQAPSKCFSPYAYRLPRSRQMLSFHDSFPDVLH